MHDLNLHIFLTWGISLLSILLMLLRPKGLPEAVWISAGAILLVLTHSVTLRNAGHAIYEGHDVYLFLLGMMTLAEVARQEKVFDWIANIAARRADGSAARLFLLIYLAGTAVTVFLSNDATAVVLTPAVLAVVRHAKVKAKPYLLACAFIANAASFVLPISNPANLVVFGEKLPSLMAWLRVFLLPAMASIAVTFVVLRLLSRRDLDCAVEMPEPNGGLSTAGKLSLAGIAIAAMTLTLASAAGWRLGAPTFAAGMLTLALVSTRDRQVWKTTAKGISWPVIALVGGLFIIVEALNGAGMLQVSQAGLSWLMHTADGYAKFIGAFAVALLSNGMNNLPVGLASGISLQRAHSAPIILHSVLIGVDLGPNLSVTGSLATILWLIALRREREEITAWEFLKTGAVVMPLALTAALLLLFSW